MPTEETLVAVTVPAGIYHKGQRYAVLSLSHDEIERLSLWWEAFVEVPECANDTDLLLIRKLHDNDPGRKDEGR